MHKFSLFYLILIISTIFFTFLLKKIQLFLKLLWSPYLQDRAYVVGPFTVSMPLCLNCHVSPLTLERTRECPGGCGYRVCIDCQNQRPMETLLHRLECPILANAISNGTFSWVIFNFIYKHSEKNHALFVYKMGYSTFSSFDIARGKEKLYYISLDNRYVVNLSTYQLGRRGQNSILEIDPMINYTYIHILRGHFY